MSRFDRDHGSGITALTIRVAHTWRFKLTEPARQIMHTAHDSTRKSATRYGLVCDSYAVEAVWIGSEPVGLIFFLGEARARKDLEHLLPPTLEENGWPRWCILLDKKRDTSPLGTLTRHLRKAVSRVHLSFSSDDPDLRTVEIEFEDAGGTEASPHWAAKINSADLKPLCDRFTEELQALAG